MISSMLTRLRSAWKNVARRDRAERELDDEIRHSYESLVDDLVRSGLSRQEARRTATLEFGGVEGVKERVRDARRGAALDALLRDVRYAGRLLRRNPVFTVVASLSLAIGIGANTAMFTIANGLLLRPPAGTDPTGLVDIFRAQDGQAMGNFTTSYPYYRDVCDRSTALAGLFAFDLNLKSVTVGSTDGTEMAFAMLVTSNYFSVLGVRPEAGRLFDPIDDASNRDGAPFIVVSRRYWQRRFGGDPSIAGKTVQLNRRPFTVLGVAEAGFRGTNVAAADLWIPMAMVDAVEPGSRRLSDRSYLDLGMGGRLKPAASRTLAAAELQTVALALEREHPADDHGMRLRVAPLSSVPGPIATVAAGLLAALLLVVGAVLIIACANVSGVLLARAASRRREIAVRIAIGAGRGRLFRQFLTETAVLFAFGAVGGLFLARAMTSLLLATLPASAIPIEVSLPLDMRVAAFTLAVSLASALFAGLAPALHASRADVVVALKDESQGPTNRLRLRSAFVVAQVAFSITLVVLAGLLVRALQRAGAVDQGFDPRGVEVASVDLRAAGYTAASGPVFADQLMDRVRAMAGVDAASLAQWMPGRGGSDVRVIVPGVTPPEGDAAFIATWNAVSPGFFRTLRAPMTAGRDFLASDRGDAERVAIASESAARSLWPGQSAVGKYVTWLGTRETTNVKVVGVVPDLTPRSPTNRTAVRERRRDGSPVVSRPLLMLYVPLAQRFPLHLSVFVRANSVRRLAPEIRSLVKSMDANLPMALPQPLDAQTGPIYFQLRLAASVAGSVGAVGLLLAAIGVYGVAAYTTQCRTREFGVRMALGAKPADVIRMVLRQGMSLIVTGSAIGLALAVAASRLFSALLTGVSPLDPATLGGSAVLFAVVGLIACYMPARRATRIDAMVALRYE